MKTTIENYRGIEIWFDSNIESFQCDIDDERSVKKSYSSVKKFIDEYIKENNVFKPFYVEANPMSHFGDIGNKLKIVGIRKDGRFVAEDKNGKKQQIPDYRLDHWMEVNSDNKFLCIEFARVRAAIDALRKEEDDIKSKFKVRTLAAIKKDLLAE